MPLRRHRGEGAAEAPEPAPRPVIDTSQLTGVFAPPMWLRDIGTSSWFLLGFALLVSALIALMALTETIVMPLITAAIVAAVASPLVRKMNEHGVPRALGAALMLVAIMLLAAGLFLMIIGGITAETSSVTGQLSGAKDTIAGWLRDIGVDPGTVENAKSSATTGANESVSTLLNGLISGVERLSSLVFFLALTALSLFFLLKDGPQIRAWGERQLGVPIPVAQIITGRTLGALRGYFLGVTVVAVFNAIVVTIGALVLGAPLIGTIAVVTFLGAYIPYLGAWAAAAFAVLLTLGGAGADAAAGMVVVQLLANGILQQLVQPFAMGAALGIHPLAVLVVTIAGGALFGAVGLILAAPLTSAVTRIIADLREARKADEAEEAGGNDGGGGGAQGPPGAGDVAPAGA